MLTDSFSTPPCAWDVTVSCHSIFQVPKWKMDKEQARTCGCCVAQGLSVCYCNHSQTTLGSILTYTLEYKHAHHTKFTPNKLQQYGNYFQCVSMNKNGLMATAKSIERQQLIKQQSPMQESRLTHFHLDIHMGDGTLQQPRHRKLRKSS